MYKQFYQGMSLTELPLFALVLFIAVFLASSPGCSWRGAAGTSTRSRGCR